MTEWITPQLALGERIGFGGMAEVFRGCQIQPGGFERQVAVKRLLSHRAGVSDIRALFQREASLYSRLNHPNIVQVFSTEISNDDLIIIMEYIAGKTLLDIWTQFNFESKKIPLPFAAHIAREVAFGLEYAHSLVDSSTGIPLHVVHRDISPENIIVSYGGQVKILDFGIAKALDQAQLTKTGVLKGKLRYLSPEAVQGGTIDARSDIYALGVVLWELLADRELVDAEFPPQMFRQITAGEVPAITSIRDDLPPEADEILKKALAKDPGQRYQTAREFAGALDSLIPAMSSAFLASECSSAMSLIFRGAAERERTLQLELKGRIRRERRVRPFRQFLSTAIRLAHPRTAIVRVSAPIKAALAAALIVLNVLHFANKSAASDQASFQAPASMADLAAWFRVESIGSTQGKLLPTWRDRTEHHFDAVQENPLWQPRLTLATDTDLPVVHFDGKQSFLTSPGIASAIRKGRGFTVALVGRVNGNETHYFWSLQQPDKDTDIARIGGHMSNIFFMKSTAAPGSVYDYSKPVDLEKFSVLTFTLDHGSARFYRNGELIIEKELDEPPALESAGEFTIGQKYTKGDPSFFLHGDIAELMFFERPLSDEARKNAEKYLTQKFAASLGHS